MQRVRPLLRGAAASPPRVFGRQGLSSIFFGCERCAFPGTRELSTLSQKTNTADINFRKDDALLEVSDFLKGEPCHYSTLYEGSFAFLIGRERIGKSHLLSQTLDLLEQNRDGKQLVPFIFNFEGFHGSFDQFLRSFRDQFKDNLKRIPKKLTASEVLSIYIGDHSVSGAARLAHGYTLQLIADNGVSFHPAQLEDVSRTLKALENFGQQDEEQLDPAIGCEALLRVVEALCSATGMTRHDTSIMLTLGAVARDESLELLRVQLDPADEAEGWLYSATEGVQEHQGQAHGLCELSLVLKYIEAVPGSCVIVRGIDSLALCDFSGLGFLFSRMWIGRYVSGRHKVPTIMESNNQSHLVEHYLRLGWVSNSESDFVPSIAGDIPVGYLPRFIEHGEWSMKETRATLEPLGYEFEDIADIRSRVGTRVSDLLDVLRTRDETGDLDAAIEGNLAKRHRKVEQRLNSVMSSALSRDATCRLDLVRFLEAFLESGCSVTYWSEGGEEFVSSPYTQELLKRNVLHMHVARPYITMSDEIVGVPVLHDWLKEQNDHVTLGARLAYRLKSIVLGGYYFRHLNYEAGSHAPLH